MPLAAKTQNILIRKAGQTGVKAFSKNCADNTLKTWKNASLLIFSSNIIHPADAGGLRHIIKKPRICGAFSIKLLF